MAGSTACVHQLNEWKLKVHVDALSNARAFAHKLDRARAGETLEQRGVTAHHFIDAEVGSGVFASIAAQATPRLSVEFRELRDRRANTWWIARVEKVTAAAGGDQ
jgi:hypothetical protein